MDKQPVDSRFIEPCTECRGTGLMEIVMCDMSREPWPCFYCEAGARIREARAAVNTFPPDTGNG